ncbi:MAG: tyrosine-type recombinase/integrase [Clostridiales bacterium]|nr:tyrosine-type recombinase/integrase [Clostridiales bacterium]
MAETSETSETTQETAKAAETKESSKPTETSEQAPKIITAKSADEYKKVFEFCEVPYVTVHGLRHTYASLLISSGTDPRTAAAQLGHSSPSLTMNIYANPQNEAKRKAGDLIGNIMGGKYQ